MAQLVPVLWAFALLSLTACRDADVAAADTTGNSVSCILPGPRMFPATAVLHPGDTLRATATFIDCPGPPRVHPFRWRSRDPVIATVDSANGLITARSVGATTITATAVEDTSQSTVLTLQVQR